MSDLDLVVSVVGIVAVMRKKWPAIDGLLVPVLVLLISLGAVLLEGAPPATLMDLFREGQAGLKLAAQVVGVMFGIGYAGTKLGQAMKVDVTPLAATLEVQTSAPDPGDPGPVRFDATATVSPSANPSGGSTWHSPPPLPPPPEDKPL